MPRKGKVRIGPHVAIVQVKSVFNSEARKQVVGMNKMKDSRIEWLGEIPASWEKSKIKYRCEFPPKSYNKPKNDDVEIEYTPMEHIKNGYYIPNSEKIQNLPSSLTQYNEGDIVVAKVTPCFENGNIAIMSNIHNGYGLGSSELFVLRAKSVLDRYLFYWLQNEHFKARAISTMTGTGGLKRVSGRFVANSELLCPPLPEQQAITTYLDRKCAEIDALSRDIKNQIETLKQYKQSVITEAVTKGLDPDVEMKDSGIDWIGKIPTSWEVSKLKYVTRLRNEKKLFHPETDNYIGLENIRSYRNEIVATDSMYEPSIQSVCRKGDVMFGRLRPYLAKVVIAPYDAFCTGELLQFSWFYGDKRFLRYFLLSHGFMDRVNASTYGSKMPRVSAEFIINSMSVCPPLAEQQAIATYLDHKCAEIDSTIMDKEDLLNVLNNYKKSLIFECVTGKGKA